MMNSRRFIRSPRRQARSNLSDTWTPSTLAASRNALSARQHLDQPIQIFLAIEERLHQDAFVFAVHTHIVDIAGEPGMAVSRYAGVAQVAAIRRAGAHGGNDRCSRPKLGGKFCDRTQDLLM